MSHTARHTGRTSRFPRVASCLVAVFVAGICLVAAGRGHLGSPSATSTGDGSLVTTSFNPCFSVSPAAGETATSVVSRLITAINTDANFSATMIGVGTTDYQILRTGGGDVSHIVLSETDPGIKAAGVSFDAPGRGWAAINRIFTIAGNGNYRLAIAASTGPVYDRTFDTTAAPTNTVAGLNTALDATLAQAGFCTFLDSASGLKFIQKPGARILSANLSATDTAISSFTVDVTDAAPLSPVGSCGDGVGAGGGTPTLSEFGMFVLVALLTGAALLVIRRRSVRQAS